MKILALDISTTTGWAYGTAGSIPKIGIERLRPKSMKDEDGDKAIMMDRIDASSKGIAGFIRDVCFIEDDRPDLIAFEAALLPFIPSQGDDDPQKSLMRNMDSILTTLTACQVVVGIAGLYGIRTERVSSQTWMKHYTGKGRHGSREEGKAASIAQGIRLGYLPITCKDDNLADACGIYDWASAIFGRRPSALVLR